MDHVGIHVIYDTLSGLPRKANGLAHHALTAAALAKRQTVTSEHVQAALPETT